MRLTRASVEPESSSMSGTPKWLISFGDMMTLFLCFFIVLVTMAAKQDAGLMASGLGPFVAALETHGMDSALEGADRLARVNEYRVRFGLAPLKNEEYLVGAPDSRRASDVETFVTDALARHAELGQPLVAVFAPSSSALSDDSRRYLELLSNTLRPGRGQTLVLEGHALDGDATLALRRARAVARQLVREQGFVATRVEARAWLDEERALGAHPRCVDARIVEALGEGR